MRRTLGELITGRKPVSAKPEDSIALVARKLKARRVGCAPIVDKDGALVGIFTERDLLNRVVAAGKDVRKTPVGRVMTRNVIVAEPGTTVFEALKVMRKNAIRHLPILKAEKLVGIVAQRDIITTLLEIKNEEIGDLKQLLDTIPIEPGVG